MTHLVQFQHSNYSLPYILIQMARPVVHLFELLEKLLQFVFRHFKMAADFTLKLSYHVLGAISHFLCSETCPQI